MNQKMMIPLVVVALVLGVCRGSGHTSRRAKQAHIRSLFRNHDQGTPASAMDEERSIFEATTELREALDNAQKESMRRRLQPPSCSLDKVFVNNCTLAEYCDEVNAGDPTVEISCSGDISGTWEMTSASQESCIYFSLGEQDNPLPYREDKYDASTDVCFQIVGVLTFNQSSPTDFTTSYEYLRPLTGVFEEYSTLASCPDAPPEEQFTAGFCQSCSGAEINEVSCNGCSPCPEGSDGFKSLDCSNIAPEMVTSCDSDDDDVFLAFGEYIGSICTYNALVSGRCSLEQFCNLFQVAEMGIEDIVCEGDVDGSWSVKLWYEEECYYNVTDISEVPSVYDETKFMMYSGAYCSKTGIEISFQGGTGVSETYLEEFTRPEASKGTISIVSDLEPCDLEDSDYDFGGGVCSEDCGDLFVGDDLCTSGCKMCPEESLVYTCTNIDPSLEESCNEDEDVVTPALIAYFEKITQMDDNGSAPSDQGGSPPTNSNAPPTESVMTNDPTETSAPESSDISRGESTSSAPAHCRLLLEYAGALLCLAASFSFFIE